MSSLSRHRQPQFLLVAALALAIQACPATLESLTQTARVGVTGGTARASASPMPGNPNASPKASASPDGSIVEIPHNSLNASAGPFPPPGSKEVAYRSVTLRMDPAPCGAPEGSFQFVLRSQADQDALGTLWGGKLFIDSVNYATDEVLVFYLAYGGQPSIDHLWDDGKMLYPEQTPSIPDDNPASERVLGVSAGGLFAYAFAKSNEPVSGLGPPPGDGPVPAPTVPVSSDDCQRGSFLGAPHTPPPATPLTFRQIAATGQHGGALGPTDVKAYELTTDADIATMSQCWRTPLLAPGVDYTRESLLLIFYGSAVCRPVVTAVNFNAPWAGGSESTHCTLSSCDAAATGAASATGVASTTDGSGGVVAYAIARPSVFYVDFVDATGAPLGAFKPKLIPPYIDLVMTQIFLMQPAWLLEKRISSQDAWLVTSTPGFSVPPLREDGNPQDALFQRLLALN